MKVLFLESAELYLDLLPAGLRQVGCTVQFLNEVLDGALEGAIAEFQPDFVLMMGWSTFPTPERITCIRQVLDQRQIPLVYWATEDPLWYDAWSLPLVQALRPDLVATICTEYVERYQALGLQAVLLPFGYNEELYQTVEPKPEYACDIAVVANFYTMSFDQLNRTRSIRELLVPLLDQGYQIKLWGNNWELASEYGIPVRPEMVMGYLDHREASAVYNSAKIVLGLQNEFDFATNLTMRTCEVLGAGGFLLTSRTKAVEAFFEQKTHLVMSSSPEETLALVRHYLTRPRARARIARTGQAFVRAKHTYAQRVRELLLALLQRLPKRTVISMGTLPRQPYTLPAPPTPQPSGRYRVKGRLKLRDESDSSGESGSGDESDRLDFTGILSFDFGAPGESGDESGSSGGVSGLSGQEASPSRELVVAHGLAQPVTPPEPPATPAAPQVPEQASKPRVRRSLEADPVERPCRTRFRKAGGGVHYRPHP